MKSRKPHKGISKRVKITARGKVLRHKAGFDISAERSAWGMRMLSELKRC